MCVHGNVVFVIHDSFLRYHSRTSLYRSLSHQHTLSHPTNTHAHRRQHSDVGRPLLFYPRCSEHANVWHLTRRRGHMRLQRQHHRGAVHALDATGDTLSVFAESQFDQYAIAGQSCDGGRAAAAVGGGKCVLACVVLVLLSFGLCSTVSVWRRVHTRYMQAY